MVKKINDGQKVKKGHPILRKIGYVLLVLFTFLSTLIYWSVRWCLSTWKHLTMTQLVGTLTAPIAGTGNGMIGQYIQKCLVPALIMTAITIVVLIVFTILNHSKRLRNIIKFSIMKPLVLIILVCCLYVGGYKGAYKIYNKLDVGTWIYNQTHPSTFIDKNYVDPSTAKLTYPTKKRNVIYIFLESMEMTYANKANGGSFKRNVIPELTKLSEANENFSGTSNKLNGGVALSGATWTMGAMFGQTSGLPLKPTGNTAGMENASSYFPKMTVLGDLLQKAGYNQTLLLGSDASFGGRRLYFKTHGNYKIHDYLYAKKVGWIPKDYSVFWGYEDEKLFKFAKKELASLSSKSKPFNLTMLTVDTHFEDGYKCRLCDNEFHDQYSDVMHCSSRQVTKFVNWAKTQSWYKNTTIVISGDHPTMDSDFCDSVPDSYNRRVYTAYINAAVKTKNKSYRSYSTFDNFPTTLAAMGVKIKGDRLGLGTNLFSGKQTLLEKYGETYINNELSKTSRLLQRLETTSSKLTGDSLRRANKEPLASYTTSIEGNKLYVFTSTIDNIGSKNIDYLEIKAASDSKGSNAVTAKMKKTATSGRKNEGYVDISSFKKKGTKKVYVTLYLYTKKGKKLTVGETTVNLS